MKILALDASTEACSVALLTDGGIHDRQEIAPRRHAELILSMVDAVLMESNHKLKDLDALAFGRGPGAFTGVRIAAGVTQGLALGADLPVIPVSSLATLAQGAVDKSTTLFAAIDARMGEIYWAVYESAEDGVARLLSGEQVSDPDAVDIATDAPFFGVGTGWGTYRANLKKLFDKQITGIAPERYPLARDMLPLAVKQWKNGDFVSAERALPVYLRDKVV